MKKSVLIVALLTAISIIPAFSFGIGGAFGLNFVGGVGPGALFSFSPDAYPAVFGVGLSFGDGSFNLGVTGDWWLYHTNLVSILSLYIGPGAYLDLRTSQNNTQLGIGARIPIGLQAWILDPLELFFELAPSIGFVGGRFPAFGMQGAVGFRFWF